MIHDCINNILDKNMSCLLPVRPKSINHHQNKHWQTLPKHSLVLPRRSFLHMLHAPQTSLVLSMINTFLQLPVALIETIVITIHRAAFMPCNIYMEVLCSLYSSSYAPFGQAFIHEDMLCCIKVMHYK